MSENQPNNQKKPAIESSQTQGASLFSRLRIIVVLALVVAGLWAVIQFTAPNSAGKSPILGVFEQQDNSETTSPTVTDIEFGKPKEMLSSLVDVLNVPKDASDDTNEPKDEKAVEEEAKTVPLVEDEVLVEEEPTEVSIEAVEEKEAEDEVEVEVREALVLQAEVQKQMSRRDRVIELLKCQVNLNSSRNHTRLFRQVLSQCYAVMMYAKVAIADYKLLKDITDEGGVPNHEQITRQFKQAVTQAMRGSYKDSGIEKNILDDVIAFSRSLFTIRKKGLQEGDGVEAVIGRAEHYLTQGKYTKAKSELEALPEGAKNTFADFYDVLAQHMAFERMIEKLDMAVQSEEVRDAL